MKQAYVVTDLGYGDSGKGSIVDFLVRDKGASLVVRYNGGAQAAHNVVLPDGRHHTFAQWGSGTFAGALTFLSRHVIVHPFALLREAEVLGHTLGKNPWDLLAVDGRCSVVTPYQQAMNRLKEFARGDSRHGSCGIGIGETVEDRYQEYSLTVKDLRNRPLLRRKLELTRDVKIAMAERLDLPEDSEVLWQLNVLKDSSILDKVFDLYAIIGTLFTIHDPPQAGQILKNDRCVVFEGAQGVMIDETYGFYPHTTWSNCTDFNAREMLRGQDFKVERIGVLRCYATRHGPGPFVSYDEDLTERFEPVDHNKFHPFQREFRCGWFDVPAAKYAITVNQGVDYLAINHLDQIRGLPTWGWCQEYRLNGDRFDLSPPLYPTIQTMEKLGETLMKCKPWKLEVPVKHGALEVSCLETIQDKLGHRVGITSRGPTHEDKRWEI